jgi:hypothetical protein
LIQKDPLLNPVIPGRSGRNPYATDVAYADELKAAMTIDHPEQRGPTPLRIAVEVSGL